MPSTNFPGELALACPKCYSRDVTMTVIYGPGGRLGDPGATNVNICNYCNYRGYEAATPMKEVL